MFAIRLSLFAIRQSERVELALWASVSAARRFQSRRHRLL